MNISAISTCPIASAKEAASGEVKSNRAVSSSSPSPLKSKPSSRIFIYSLAGTVTAVGLFVGRWFTAETGEILLLFAAADDHGPASDGLCQGGDHSGYATVIVDVEAYSEDFAPSDSPLGRCPADGNHYSLTHNVGEMLVSIANSPFLRSLPLVLLFFSSTALVVGVMLIRKEVHQFLLWMQTCQEYGEECSEWIMSTLGVSNSEELTLKTKEMHTRWKNSLATQVEKTVECMDGMVLDDALRKLIKSGVQFSMGVAGGVFLYSIPEEVFAVSLKDAGIMRRQLIHAADPSFEQIVFQPGGVWYMLPLNLRESLIRYGLTKGTKSGDSKFANSSENWMETASLNSSDQTIGDDDINNNDDESSDTPLVSPVPEIDAVRDSIQTYPQVQCGEIVCGAGGERIPGKNNNGESSREAIADVMHATIENLTVREMKSLGTRKLRAVRDEKSGGNDKGNPNKNKTQQRGLHQLEQQDQQQQPCLPSLPLVKLEKYLHRLAMGASFLFLCHLRLSPSTRRAWGSAAKFLTSLGLASAAIGTGVASAVLRSNNLAASAITTNAVMGVLYSKILDRMGASQIELSMDISNRVQWIFSRLREKIQENKRLQAAFAFMALYVIRSSSRKSGIHYGKAMSLSQNFKLLHSSK